MTRLVRLLRRRDGYTLVELLAVLLIFLTVMTALVALFTSGARAELDVNRRFQAQQAARIALDKLRRELHCSDGLTKIDGTALADGVAVSGIRVSLPSQCPSALGVATVVTYDMLQVTSTRWKLRRTKGSVTTVIADYITTPSGLSFTYTKASASTRALLHVDFTVNVYPNEGWKRWRLVDDIVLRNTLRQ